MLSPNKNIGRKNISAKINSNRNTKMMFVFFLNRKYFDFFYSAKHHL